MNILFVCRHNRFSSKVAEAFFNKINKSSKHHVKSAGIIKGVPVAPIVRKIGKENGIGISSETSGVTEKMIYWADVFVIVANDVPVEIFERYKKLGKKVIVWKVRDASQNDENSIRRIFLEIKNKIEGFQKDLGKY